VTPSPTHQAALPSSSTLVSVAVFYISAVTDSVTDCIDALHCLLISGSGSKRGRAFVASPRRLRPQCRSTSHPL